MTSLKAFFAHLDTTVIGILSLVCGSSALLGIIPPPYGQLAVAACTTLNGLGFIMAASARKVEADKAASQDPALQRK